jgi:hypothetical protein
VLVGGRPAQERHVDRAARVEQKLLAIELDEPHYLILRNGVQPSAMQTRVDECVESDPRDQPRPPGGRLAIEVRHHALRQAICLDPVVERQASQRRGEPPVPTDSAPDKTLPGEAVKPSTAAVPLPRGEHERKVARPAGFFEALRERD